MKENLKKNIPEALLIQFFLIILPFLLLERILKIRSVWLKFQFVQKCTFEIWSPISSAVFETKLEASIEVEQVWFDVRQVFWCRNFQRKNFLPLSHHFQNL